jgi:methionyl aminopeptidase
MTSIMQDDILEKYLKAGEILSRVRSEAKDKIKVGASLLEVAEFGKTDHKLGADGSGVPM